MYMFYVQFKFLDFFHRNGRLLIWECTIEPDDWVEWKPPAKKAKDSDSEDDIDVEKAVERTEKQKARTEDLLELSNKSFYITFIFTCL